MVKRRKPFRPRCRYCRSNKEVIPILYAREVDEELLERQQRGEIKIGAAFVGVDRPNWHCRACGYEFLR